MNRYPPKIIIAGAPASGKGTQCEFIRDVFNVVHLSTGDMLRLAANNKTDMGLLAKSYMDNGQLVPDSVIIGVVMNRLEEDDCKLNGWLLDGFPRTAAQAEALLAAGIHCDLFILLDVADSALVERVVGRRSDPVTGKIYHMKYSPPDSEEIRKRLVQRDDDTEEKVKVRINAFHANMSAILNIFQDKLLTIDGNRHPKVIWNSIYYQLSKHVKKSVTFVVGGLGTGKKHISGMIAEKFGYVCLSLQDLIRQEHAYDTAISHQIIKANSMAQPISSDILVNLIVKGINSVSSCHKFIVIGFPRHEEDLTQWYKTVRDNCTLDYVLYLTCSQDIAFQRVQSLNGSVVPIPTLIKQMKLFQSDIDPVLKSLSYIGKLRTFSTNQSPNNVFRNIFPLFSALSWIPPYDRSVILIKPDAVSGGHVPSILQKISGANLAVIALKFVIMTKDIVNEYFSHMVDDSKFVQFTNLMISGPSLVVVVEGFDVIRRTHMLVGPVNPATAKKTHPDSLRALYGIDTIKNACEVSDSFGSAYYQVNFWLNPNCSGAKATLVRMESAGSMIPVQDLPIEDTLAVVKPSAVENGIEEIEAIILAHGFEIVSKVHTTLTERDVLEFYNEHKDKDFFPALQNHMVSAPIVAMHLRRHAAIIGLRHLMGGGDMQKCRAERPDSLRARFALDGTRNAIHGSDSVQSAVRELTYYFPLFGKMLQTKSTSSETFPVTTAQSLLDPGRIAREAKRRQKNQVPQTMSLSKHANMLSYLNNEINPLLKDLVESLLLKRPKDITGYLIKTLIERQRKSLESTIPETITSPSKLKPLPAIKSLNGELSVSKSVDSLSPSYPSNMSYGAIASNLDDFYGDACNSINPDDYQPTYNGVPLTIEMANTEIARLKSALSVAAENLMTEKWLYEAPAMQPAQVEPVSTTEVEPIKRLEIVHFSDLTSHSTSIEELQSDNKLAQLAYELQQFIANGSLIAFTGNFLGPSVNYHMDHFAKMMDILKTCGVSYGVLGNQEFSFGIKNLKNFVHSSSITWILSNVREATTSSKKPLCNCEEDVIVTWNGITIGIMGIVDNWLVHCPNVSVDEYVYLDSIKTATSTCASLRQRGAQMVIALTHCQGDIDEALSRIEGIDLVLGGHSNSYETWRFDSNQCGTKTCGASNLTQVVATYVHGVDSKANINWPPCRFTIHKNIPANATVKQILSELREISENNLKTPIGATGITLKGSAHLVRTSECPIGNMLTDIMKQYTYGTHIAFLNGGAIRMNEEIPPKILTVEDILRILPFNDYLATVELTGHQVKALLENCVSKYPEPNGRFCHVSNGLMCVFSNQVDDKVVRVQSVTMWNNAIEGNAIFSCVMPGYMAEGKEGFKVLKGLKLMRPREFCPSLYNVIFEFFRKRSLAQSLQSRDQVVEFETLRPRVEKRIKAVGVFTTTKTITNSHDLGETQLSMEESQFNVDDLDAGSVMSTDAVGESDSQILEDD